MQNLSMGLNGPLGPHRVPTHIAPDIRHFDQAWPPELQAWPIMEDLNHSTAEFANKNGDLDDRKTSLWLNQKSWTSPGKRVMDDQPK